MAKKPAPAPAEASEAIPERKFRTLKDGRVIPIFEPGPNGEVTAEEQAWADEEQRTIIGPRVQAIRDAANAEEVANHKAKLERAEARKKRDHDWRDQIDARMKALEEKVAANG